MNQESVRLHIHAAGEEVDLADDLYKRAHVRTAVSRSYYAMFYAATALLASRGLLQAFRRHQWVRTALLEDEGP